MFLSTTTSKIKLIASSAALLDVSLDWVEVVKATAQPYDIDTKDTLISGPGTSDISGSPAASNVRRVKGFTVRNRDASLPDDVTIIRDVGGVVAEKYKETLNPGDTLQYVLEAGFYVFRNSSLLDVALYVPNDVISAVTAFADITGLTQALKSGHKYIIDACVQHINESSATGSRFAYNIGAAPTLAQFSQTDTVTNSPTAGAVSIGSQTARDTAFTAQTTGQAAIGPGYINGVIIPSADGIFALRVASETAIAAGVTVKAGSYMMLRETNN